MNGVTVKYKVKFGNGKPKPVTESTTPTASPKPPSRAARMLALAHYVDRLIEDGTIKDYAEAARLLGITRARMTQVMNLLTLSPQLQERVLTGDIALSERALRAVAGEAVWKRHGAV